jgi:hypothetical protein
MGNNTGGYCTIIIACLAFALPRAVAHRGQLGQGATPSDLTQSEIFRVISWLGSAPFFLCFCLVFVLFCFCFWFFASFQWAQKRKKKQKKGKPID